MDTSSTMSDIIRFRTSRRTYQTDPFTEELKQNIELKIKEVKAGPLRTNIELTLISLEETSNQKLKLGTYGFIKGARYFVVGQISPSKNGFLDYGFTLESLILELTRMGLGTCWLGGTFDRGDFAKTIRLKENQVIPAITPIGYATTDRGLHDRIIRIGAGSTKRLPREQLFFDKASGMALTPVEGHPATCILDSVRIAPSASNNQPWRIVSDGNLFRFYIARKPFYQKVAGKIDLQMIDIGIAMAHFDLVAREYGRKPEWNISEGTPPFQGWEYVISVLLPE